MIPPHCERHKFAMTQSNSLAQEWRCWLCDQESLSRSLANQVLAAGGARAPQWQPDLKLWARRLLAQVNDIREYGQSEGLDPAEVLALTLSELLAAASGVGPSPPHEAGK